MTSVAAETVLALGAVLLAVGYLSDRDERDSKRRPFEPDTRLPQTVTSADGIQSNLAPWAYTNRYDEYVGIGRTTSRHILGGAAYLERSRNLNGVQVARGERAHRTFDLKLRTQAENRLASLPLDSAAAIYWQVVKANS